MRNLAKKKKEDNHFVNRVRSKSCLKSKQMSICHLIHSRTLGRPCDFKQHVHDILRTRIAVESPLFMRCHDFDLGKVDKVFASRWVNPNVIVAGTKCNRLLVLQLQTSAVHEIPLIPSIHERPSIETVGGIHGMDMSPNGTFLATGGSNENEVNVFDATTLTPKLAFVRGHNDWVFDMRWLSERRLVSCSRDGKLAVWSLDNYLEREGSFDENGTLLTDRYLYDEPISVSVHEDKEGGLPLRALALSRDINRLSVVTTRKLIKVFDTGRDLSEIRSIEMQACCNDTVTVTSNPANPWEIAVGSQTHINIYDVRAQNGIFRNFRSKHYSYGVRSVQYNDHMLSYSTGRGSVFFYDVRGGYHLDLNRKAFSVNLGKLPVSDDRHSLSASSLSFPCVAIYTHEYDHTRTRIFCAGGPLAACESGSYASLWW